MGEAVAYQVIDLRAEICPMTFVRTRLALDGLEPGQVLAVLLNGAESQARVPRTVRDQGHRVVSAEVDPAGTMRLVVIKGTAERNF